ncbi:Arginine--tRNA ligase [Trichinella spiralis]|uniref:Arginine--tRNA ligase n=1 Tax=Trichinella spiralis TaxID=6334 RepID=A0ABR3K7A2_TRISP
MDPELDIYPFSAPLDFDINGVKAGSLETPLFCLTNEHPTCNLFIAQQQISFQLSENEVIIIAFQFMKSRGFTARQPLF